MYTLGTLSSVNNFLLGAKKNQNRSKINGHCGTPHKKDFILHRTEISLKHCDSGADFASPVSAN